MATIVHHAFGAYDESILFGEIVKLSAGIGVSKRNLNGLDIQFFGEINGVADALTALARQTKDEVAVHDEAELFGVLGELAGALHGCAFLDVLENLLIARFIAHDEQAASSFTLRFQSFVVGGYA